MYNNISYIFMPLGCAMRLNTIKLRELMSQRQMTATALARSSGVSRATIARILGRGSAEVHRGTEEKLSGALGLAAGALDKEGVRSEYLAQVAKQHQLLDFTGLGIVAAPKAMSMDRGYSPLTFLESVEAGRCSRDPSGRLATRREKPGSRTLGLADALARGRRAFLLGDPGSGKTTVLRHLARAYATDQQRGLSYPGEPLIPVFVRLADWAEVLRTDDSADLVDAALASLGVADPTSTSVWLRAQLGEGNVLVLLDGLDEVPDPQTQGPVIEKIRSLVATQRESRILVSSRVVGFETPNLGARFDKYVVQPLDEEGMRQFAAEWFAFRHDHDSRRDCRHCGTRREELRHAITDHPQVKALAGNPMMLTILILLHEAGAALPRRRWQLYEKITEAFLFSWEQKKRTALAGAADRRIDFDDREVFWVLESLALEMQRRDWTLVARWWLSEHIAAFLRDELGFEPDRARVEADTLIWSLLARSDILVARGPDRFGFSHLAFQEYLAARAVAAMDDPVQEIRPYCYHPRWRDVVPMVSAQLDRRRAPQLLRTILDDPDPTGRFLRRGLLTALACLAEAAPLHDRALLEQIGNETVNLGRTRWTGISLDAMHQLARLRGTRLESFAVGVERDLIASAEETRCAEVQDPVPAEPARSLEDVLPSLPDDLESVRELLGDADDTMTRHAAAHVLAGYATSGRVKWQDVPIEDVERVLMSPEHPCQHALDALRGLVDARELRKLGIPREARILRAIGDLRDRIRVLFIFGSSARGQQGADSDIDLMILGDVSLRELTPCLRQAEQELGRQVNAVIYSDQQWRERRRRKDDFVTNVLQQQKVFIVGGPDELGPMAE